MYVITGATGNTGKLVAQMLLERGHKVRVIGRSAERLAPLTKLGAEAVIGDLANVALLEKAFTGATAVYSMIPPNPAATDFRAYQTAMGEATIRALGAAKVQNVVHLSSLGAHMPDKVGPVKGLYDQEARLNKLGVNVLHLRPTYFMENHLWSVGMIKQMGMIGSATAADVKFPMIATRDIAEVAVDLLTVRGFGPNSVLELLGPCDYSMNDVAATIGAAIGRPGLKYVQFPVEDAIKGMVGMGLSQDLAKNYAELSMAISERIGIRAIARTPRTTTPTTLEAFVRSTFVPAFIG